MNLLPSSALMIYFNEYELTHKTRGNKICHFFGVPGVTLSLLGLLSHAVLWSPLPASESALTAFSMGLFSSNIPLFQVDLGIILLAFAAVFSIRIDFKLSIPYLLALYFGYLTFRHLSLPVLIGIQLISWIFQFVGHYRFEKKSPAFFKNLESLLIGPLWIFAYGIGYYRPT